MDYRDKELLFRTLSQILDNQEAIMVHNGIISKENDNKYCSITLQISEECSARSIENT